MCLLTFFPAGQQPDLDALILGAEHNGDGHGYAIAAGDRLIVHKTLDGEAAVAAFARDRATHHEGPALFHSRLRTHGPADVANCHPFPLGGDLRTVIAHNGILPPDVHPTKGDPRSDTRIAAEDYLPLLGPMRLRRNRLRAERWMGPANLMALITVDRRYRQRAYLFNEARGTWDQGVWYSNESYQPRAVRWYARSSVDAPHHWADTPDDWADDPSGSYVDLDAETCACCGEVPDLCQDWCPWCGNCWSCGRPPERCLCWTPPRLLEPRTTRT